MGFDGDFPHLLNSIIPEGDCQFLDAYAYGIGMLLTFNKEYAESDSSLKPEFMHLVISSESGESEANIKDCIALQTLLK
jgi:hypothetical protein